MSPEHEAQARYEDLRARLGAEGHGVDLDAAKERLKAFKVETPSWGYSDSGTRFKVFKQPGAARTAYERLEDAAAVHRFTGATPSVAVHIPWDRVDDYAALAAYARELGLSIGAVNPNLFQDDDYMLGSVTNADPAVRGKAVGHIRECIDIMRVTGSKVLSLWFADGTDYPGQGSFRDRKRWMEECLAEVYAEMDPGMTMLLEYKFFEPAFYHTDLADWGMATIIAKRLGPRAKTLVDLGHHPPGTNIEHIVAFLIDEGKLGGFHFNSRKYGDDDLTAGSINPHELFLIFCELVQGGAGVGGAAHAAGAADAADAADVAYMIDQSHNTKPKIEATIQTVMNIQAACARALIVDYRGLKRAQAAGLVVEAEEILSRAFNCDVGPLVQMARLEAGVPLDPLEAFRRSGYLQEAMAARRA